jgi:DNA gyrase subunit A
MSIERPDLSSVDPEIVAYIEALEASLAEKHHISSRPKSEPASLEPSEPPTTLNVITITADGYAKRTPRHLYFRQRRGGMGVFDIDSAENDPPALLTVADENESLILITDQGRAFRQAVNAIPETQVRGRGAALNDDLALLVDERIVAALPESGGTYVLLISQRGWVRRVQRAYLGSGMLQGQRFHKISEGGYLTGAAWSDGQADVFICTRKGLGIRFSERQIVGRGCLGIRVSPDDEAIAVASVTSESGVFLLSADGKGTIRLMSGLRQNKAPGAGGKIAIKSDECVGAVRVDSADDVFVISQLSKIIRFSAEEIPAKTGVVQGVNCMTLRADVAAAIVATPIAST